MFDHCVASAFGTLGYLMNQGVTARFFWIYSIIFAGNMILQTIAIKTGKLFYDHEKYQYFNKLMLCGIMAAFVGTLGVRLVNILKMRKDIVPR